MFGIVVFFLFFIIFGAVLGVGGLTYFHAVFTWGTSAFDASTVRYMRLGVGFATGVFQSICNHQVWRRKTDFSCVTYIVSLHENLCI